MSNPKRTDAVIVLTAGSCLVLGSCGYDRTLAGRNVLGGSSPIATLTGEAADDIPDDTAPSVRSLMRLEWQPIDVVVPVDGTVHGPTWRVDVRAAGPSPRQRSLHPSVRTALTLRSRGCGQVWEGVLTPFVGLGNVLAMPVMMIGDPPGTMLSPSRSLLYKRTRPGRTVAGAIPADDPATDPAPGPQSGGDADEP